ncbi:MAG: creatininase family protein [Candidatus Latescibacteria bacterium]|jgi:creatinine amidohydrolase|nr:creatininase family protein [Candidatus Latescibacterota bacterium]
MLSYESTWKEIEDASPEGAVIGIGANEQHGPHLPLNMDCLSAEYLARGIAEAFDWYQLPTLPIGASAEHMDFPGTLTLRSETLIPVFRDIVSCLKRHGISRLTIVSGHGGNWFLKMMTRELNYDDLGVNVFLVNTDRWFYPVLQELTEDQTLHHAGEHETSVVMYLRPDLVKPVEVPDDSPDLEFDLLDLVQSRKLASTGIWGFPSKASAEKGKEFLEKGLQAAIAYLRSRLALVDELGGPGAPD